MSYFLYFSYFNLNYSSLITDPDRLDILFVTLFFASTNFAKKALYEYSKRGLTFYEIFWSLSKIYLAIYYALLW